MIYIAQDIDTNSWLLSSTSCRERFGWFVDGHAYAATQNRAIPALSKVSPEELYFAVDAILRGAVRSGHKLEDIK